MKILLMSLILILSVIIICAVVAQEEKDRNGGGHWRWCKRQCKRENPWKDVVLSKITMVCGGLFAVLCLALGFLYEHILRMKEGLLRQAFLYR